MPKGAECGSNSIHLSSIPFDLFLQDDRIVRGFERCVELMKEPWRLPVVKRWWWFVVIVQ